MIKMDVEQIYGLIGDSGDIDDFESEEEIREYFTVENLIVMFSESAYSEEELKEMADYVINNMWKQDENLELLDVDGKVIGTDFKIIK